MFKAIATRAAAKRMPAAVIPGVVTLCAPSEEMVEAVVQRLNQKTPSAQPIHANTKPVAESPVPENAEPRQHILVLMEPSTMSFFAVTACMELPINARRNMRAAMAMSAVGTPKIAMIAAETTPETLPAAVAAAVQVRVWHVPRDRWSDRTGPPRWSRVPKLLRERGS